MQLRQIRLGHDQVLVLEQVSIQGTVLVMARQGCSYALRKLGMAQSGLQGKYLLERVDLVHLSTPWRLDPQRFLRRIARSMS